MQRITGSRSATSVALALMDAGLLVGAGFLASWLRFGSTGIRREILLLLDHPGFIAYAIGALWILSTTFDLYRPDAWRTRDTLLVRLAALAVCLPVVLAIGVYLVPPWRFGRGLLALTVLSVVPAQAALRAVWLLVASLPHPRPAVIVGDGPIVAALLEELGSRPSPPFHVVRHISLDEDSEQSSTVGPEAVAAADLVIVASLVPDGVVDRLAALNFRGTTVVDAAGAYAALTGRIPVQQVDSRWFIATGDFSFLARSPFHHVQRLLDIVVASVMLLLSSPLLLLAATAVRVADGPPVVFRQTRLGRFGQPFQLYKLRTMDRRADEEGPEFVAPGDPRVLPVGRLLRRWRVDELPQLINVLRGEMSLVGPRPERPDVARDLERAIPFYAYRYSVRPGLTGWAQVNLPYCSALQDHLRKLEYDLYSLRHHGPGMYALVLIRTLGAVVFRPGR